MGKVFWEDPYLTKLKTTVSSVNGNEIVFNETIAYCESGGQESDKTTINEMQVLSSRMDKKEPYLIYYILPEGHGLSVGDTVVMEIDWQRRHRLMRYHFTCELILILINRLFNKTPEGQALRPEEIDTTIKKRGAHMSESGARVDFELPTNISEYFDLILTEYNKIIAADMPIETGYLNKDHQVRYWKLPNIALVPCGGTHVRSTGEIGSITLKRERANKGVERVRISLEDCIPSQNTT